MYLAEEDNGLLSVGQLHIAHTVWPCFNFPVSDFLFLLSWNPVKRAHAMVLGSIPGRGVSGVNSGGSRLIYLSHINVSCQKPIKTFLKSDKMLIMKEK